MHYFSPVNKMPLLEIITHRGPRDWVTATCVEWASKQGKTVIVVNDGVGLLHLAHPRAVHERGGVPARRRARTSTSWTGRWWTSASRSGRITLLDEVGIDVGAKVGHDHARRRSASGMARAARRSRQVVRGRPPGPQERRRASTRYRRQEEGGGHAPSTRCCRTARSASALDRARDGRALRAADGERGGALPGRGHLRGARDGDIGAVFGLGLPAVPGRAVPVRGHAGRGKGAGAAGDYQDKYGERFTPAPMLVQLAESSGKFY